MILDPMIVENKGLEAAGREVGDVNVHVRPFGRASIMRGQACSSSWS